MTKYDEAIAAPVQQGPRTSGTLMSPTDDGQSRQELQRRPPAAPMGAVTMTRRDIYETGADGIRRGSSRFALEANRILSRLVEYLSLIGLIGAGILVAGLAARLAFGPSVSAAL
jgi:hypothetical protein